MKSHHLIMFSLFSEQKCHTEFDGIYRKRSFVEKNTALSKIDSIDYRILKKLQKIFGENLIDLFHLMFNTSIPHLSFRVRHGD